MINTNIPGWMNEKDLNILHKLAGFVPELVVLIRKICNEKI